MRTSTDCTSRAEECRRLAKLTVKPEDWQHFLESVHNVLLPGSLRQPAKNGSGRPPSRARPDPLTLVTEA
jgi:hypothetical protein